MAEYAGAAQSSASGEFVSASGDYGELLSRVGSLCVFSVASLERCCRVKPDPVYYGYVALSEKAFQRYPYYGCHASYLKSLFDKHNSEAIVVHRKTVAGEFRVPLSAGCAFNYQLYVGAAMPTDEDGKKIYCIWQRTFTLHQPAAKHRCRASYFNLWPITIIPF